MNRSKRFWVLGAILAMILVGSAATATNPVLFEIMRELPGRLDQESLTLKVAAPVTKAPTVLTSTAISASAWAEFPATDIAVGLQNHDTLQLLVVTNFDSAARMCIQMIDRNTDADPELETTDCATPCGASSATCSGASTDAEIVLPGQAREFRPSGQMCVCYMASVASADGQFSVTVR